MDIRVLGPIEVMDADGRRIDLGLRPRQLLALLTAHHGAVVRSDQIMEELWGTDGDAARRSLHTAVSALRRAIGRQWIETSGSGYRLVTPPELIDAGRFSLWVGEASSAVHIDDVLDLTARADSAWRGEPYLDVADDLPSISPEVARLRGLRMAGFEYRSRAMLSLGRATETVPELEKLVDLYPLHEPLWVLLVEALADAGRPVDALRAYERARRILAIEVGMPPSTELQNLERRVIDSQVDPPRPPVPPARFTTSRDGTRIAYWVSGTGRPLLYVPTWAGDFESAASHPRGYAYLDTIGAGRLNVWVGYRGVGTSQRDVSDVSVHARAADAEAVLDAAEIDTFDIYSQGDGVPVALNIAATLTKRVGRLVAFMPHIGLDSWLSPESMTLFVETIRTNGSFARRTMADIVLPDEPDADQRWFNRTLQSTITDELIADCLEAQMSMEVGPILDDVTAETLIITREHSNSIRPEIGPELAASLPNGRFRSVPGTAGLPWMGVGDVASLITEFLDA